MLRSYLSSLTEKKRILEWKQISSEASSLIWQYFLHKYNQLVSDKKNCKKGKMSSIDVNGDLFKGRAGVILGKNEHVEEKNL